MDLWRMQRKPISMKKGRMLMRGTSVYVNKNEQMYVLRIIRNEGMFT